MLISELQHIDRDEWRLLMESSPNVSWFQSPEAYDFFCSLPEMMTPFVVAVSGQRSAGDIEQSKDTERLTGPEQSKDIEQLKGLEQLKGPEQLKGLCVGYVTREKNPIKQFFTRRAIIYGGPLLSAEITEDELRELLNAITNPKTTSTHSPSPLTGSCAPIYIETRNFSDYSRWRRVFEECGFDYKPHYDMFIHCSNREVMTSRIHESKLRQIRKAEAEGVEITEAQTLAEVTDFYRLLSDLYRTKVRTPLFPLEFFVKFVEQRRGVLLLARKPSAQHSGQYDLIGGMLCPRIEGKVLYEWYVVGPAVVTWAAMDYANKHGIPLFDLMGAGEPDVPYGVRDFKSQFGGELREYGRFLNIRKRLLYGLGKWVMTILRKQKQQ